MKDKMNRQTKRYIDLLIGILVYIMPPLYLIHVANQPDAAGAYMIFGWIFSAAVIDYLA